MGGFLMVAMHPDTAYRVLKLEDKAGERRSVAIGLHLTGDDFTQFSVSSYGYGQPAFLTPCISLKVLDLNSEIAIDNELERAVCQMELNGYDLISDADTMVQDVHDILDQTRVPDWVTADEYFKTHKDNLDGCELIEVTSGVRAWIVIDEHIRIVDARTFKSVQASISQYELELLKNQLINEAMGRTILEAFVSDGEILITDAVRINGIDVSQRKYTDVLRRLERALPGFCSESVNSGIRLAQVVTEAEHSLRILAASDSALRPALYSKHNRSAPTLIDRYRGFNVQFSQGNKRFADLTYVDFDFKAVRTQMPIECFPAFDNEYTAIGIRPGTDRVPILL